MTEVMQKQWEAQGNAVDANGGSAVTAEVRRASC